MTTMKTQAWQVAIAAGILTGMSTVATDAQLSDDSATTSCIKTLLVPSYPPVARSSNSSATLRADVKVGADGSAKSYHIEVVSDSRAGVCFKAQSSAL